MQTLEQNQNNPLATESLKEHPIVFFDGVCGLCNRSVDFILTRDKRRTFRFAPLQGDTAKQCLTSKFHHNINNIVFVDETGQYHKSSAVVRVLRKLSGVWPTLGILLWLIPKPIRDSGYSIIARFRYKLFGKLEACRLPKPGEQDQFLP